MGETLETAEIRAIKAALVVFQGQLTVAAQALGITRADLYRKIKQYGINPAEMKKIKPYKTNDTDYILPIALHEAAKEYAMEVTGNLRPTMENGLFIETFKACFQIMKDLGMVKDEYMIPEKPVDLNKKEE